MKAKPMTYTIPNISDIKDDKEKLLYERTILTSFIKQGHLKRVGLDRPTAYKGILEFNKALTKLS